MENHQQVYESEMTAPDNKEVILTLSNRIKIIETILEQNNYKKDEINSHNTSVSQMMQDVNSLLIEMDEYFNQIEQEKCNLAKLEEKQKRYLENQEFDQENQLVVLKNNLKKEEKDLLEQKIKMISKIKQVEQDQGFLDKSLKDFEVERKDILENMEKIQPEINNLESNIFSEQQKQENDFNEEIWRLEEQINISKSEEATLLDEINDLETDISLLLRKTEELLPEQDDLKNNLTEFNIKIQNLEDGLEVYKLSYQQKESLLHQVQEEKAQKLIQLDSEIKETKEKSQEIKAENDTLEKKIKECESRIKKTDDEKHSLVKEESNLEDIQIQLSKEHATKGKAIMQAQTEIENLIKNQNEVDQEILILKNKIDELKKRETEKYSKLEDEIQKLIENNNEKITEEQQEVEKLIAHGALLKGQIDNVLSLQQARLVAKVTLLKKLDAFNRKGNITAEKILKYKRFLGQNVSPTVGNLNLSESSEASFAGNVTNPEVIKTANTKKQKENNE